MLSKQFFQIKERPSFKLEDLCKANSIDNGTSHDAITDCLNTISLAEIIYKKTPDIWNAALLTTNKKDVENFILKNKVYTSLEYFYGDQSLLLVIIFYFMNNTMEYKLGSKVDPIKYLEMDRQTLAKALDSSLKLLEQLVRINHQFY